MKIICFDLDGTLLDEEEQIHPADRSLLASRRDIPFIITTGRALWSIKGVFEQNGLFTGNDIPFPIVAQNGAVLYDKNEIIIDYFPFEHKTQFQVINTIRKFSQITFYLFGMSELYILNDTPLGSYYARIWYMPIKPFEVSGDLQLTKVMGLSKNVPDLQEVACSLSSLDVEISFSLDFLLEITPQGVDKGIGLQGLLKELDLAKTQIYIAGDGGNDLPVFNKAHKSYCPNSSSNEIISKADVIIDREDAGVLTPMLQDADYQ